jgi:O-antigen ligase
MRHRILPALLLIFLATIGINWPALPLNASLADAVFLALAAALLSMPVPRLSWHRADLAVVIYLLASLPAIAVSTDQRRSMIELVRELYLVAIYIVIAVATQHGFARTIGRGLAIGGTLLSLAGLLFVVVQLLGGPPWYAMGEVMQLPYIGKTLRLRALTPSEAMLACVLTASAPFAIVACRSERLRGWCVAAGVMAAAAALTFSHAIAGFAVALLLAAWPSFASWPRSRRVAAVAVIIVVIALNFAATISVRSISGYIDASTYHHAVDQGAMRIGDTTIAYDVMSYARIKQVAWRTFLEHPVAGIGLDRFHTATLRAYQQGLLPDLYREIDPHSTVLGRLAETGVIGGAALLFLWIAWIRMALDTARRSMIGVAAAAALAGLIVSSANADIMNFRFLWVIAGVMRGLYDANGMAIDSGRDDTVTAGTD